MADGVAVTAGSGTTIASDDIAGVHYQRVKIGIGADGSATDWSSAAPAPIVLTAGETHVGEVGGKTTLVEVQPTISTSAYTANDQIGGLQTLTSILRVNAGSGVLQSIQITDKSKNSSALTIFFFDESPTVASSDNAALDISDAEMDDKCLGFVNIETSDWSTINSGNSICSKDNIGKVLKTGASSTSLYAVVAIRSASTYASTSDLRFKYGFLAD